MVKNSVSVFLGAPLTHAHEKAAINRLRGDLQRRGISATLLVNFVARSRSGSRQVDLVVLTADRCLNVELKRVSQPFPLIAKPNGRWRQVLPEGQERPVGDHNYYDQALQQTYALSDAIEKLASAGKVPAALRGKFFKHIDTVVCVDPQIPPGSSTPPQHNVSVVGLDALPDRISSGGPGLAHWSPTHFDALIRELNLYPEGADEESEIRRLADLAAVQDYQFRFREFNAAGLFPFVPSEASVADEEILCTPGGVADFLAVPQQRTLITGASGDGKTHLAKHTAVELSGRGQLVVWLSADTYERGQFDQMLRRSVASYSTEEAYALLAKAVEAGGGCTVVIDGLEKGPDRTELIRDVHTLQLRLPIAVLATAQGAEGIEPLSPSTVIALSSPTDDQERARLATVYGSPTVADGQYRTRYSITLAAQVAAELPLGANTTDVTDAYVRKQSGDESVRAALRCLAQAMDERVITALSLRDAEQILRRCPVLAAAPSAIDIALNDCPLIINRQGFIRFEHDQLGRFLAAEHLVLAAPDGRELAHVLSQPTHHDLQETAILLENDEARRHAAICDIADWRLTARAMTGEFGPETAKQIRADITELLIRATIAAPHDAFEPPAEGEITAVFGGAWATKLTWTPTERALLAAAGYGSSRGLFLNEIGALMDATDVAIRSAITALRERDVENPVNKTVGSVFSGWSYTKPGAADAGDATAASIVIDAARTGYFLTKTNAEQTAPSFCVTSLWKSRPECFGRLYLAALLSNPLRYRELHPDDLASMPELVGAALASGSYHLRLEAIEAAGYACNMLDGETRQQMIEVLSNYTPASWDWGTSTTLIEVLAAYGEIQPMNSLDDITGVIRDALSDPEDNEHQKLAAHVVTNILEDQRVLGPFADAVYALPDTDRLTLFAMSVLADFGNSEDGSVIETNPLTMNDVAMRHLADAVNAESDLMIRALAQRTSAYPGQFGFRQMEVRAHLEALRGWAKVASELPPAATALEDPTALCWRRIDELLLSILREEDDTEGNRKVWRYLAAEFPLETTGVLSDLESASCWPAGEITQFHQLLIQRYPDQIRLLMEWALTHRDEFLGRFQATYDRVDHYAIRTLGEVGNAETADLLRHYVLDAELGVDAVNAKRAIDARLGLSG